MKEGEGALAAIPYPKPTTVKGRPDWLPAGGRFTTPPFKMAGRSFLMLGSELLRRLTRGVRGFTKKPFDATIPFQPTRLTVGTYKILLEYFFGNYSSNSTLFYRRKCLLRRKTPTKPSCRTSPNASARLPASAPPTPLRLSNVPMRTLQWEAMTKGYFPVQQKTLKKNPEHAAMNKNGKAETNPRGTNAVPRIAGINNWLWKWQNSHYKLHKVPLIRLTKHTQQATEGSAQNTEATAKGNTEAAAEGEADESNEDQSFKSSSMARCRELFHDAATKNSLLYGVTSQQFKADNLKWILPYPTVCEPFLGAYFRHTVLSHYNPGLPTAAFLIDNKEVDSEDIAAAMVTMILRFPPSRTETKPPQKGSKHNRFLVHVHLVDEDARMTYLNTVVFSGLPLRGNGALNSVEIQPVKSLPGQMPNAIIVILTRARAARDNSYSAVALAADHVTVMEKSILRFLQGKEAIKPPAAWSSKARLRIQSTGHGEHTVFVDSCENGAALIEFFSIKQLINNWGTKEVAQLTKTNTHASATHKAA